MVTEIAITKKTLVMTYLHVRRDRLRGKVCAFYCGFEMIKVIFFYVTNIFCYNTGVNDRDGMTKFCRDKINFL